MLVVVCGLPSSMTNSPKLQLDTNATISRHPDMSLEEVIFQAHQLRMLQDRLINFRGRVSAEQDQAISWIVENLPYEDASLYLMYSEHHLHPAMP